MKIVNNTECKKLFGDLNVGDVFLNCEKYYMKTEEIEAVNGYFNNAINLVTGDHAWLNSEHNVTVVNCKLVIG